MSFSTYAQSCSEDQIIEALNVYETEINPYQNGKFEHMIQEVQLRSSRKGTDFYDVVINYEYSEGGYRLLEVKAKKKDSKCETDIEITDEN